MKFLITGAGGYIGSVLVRYLLPIGQVVAVDNFIHGNNTSLLQYVSDKRFLFVNEDVRNHAAIKKLMKDVDVIIPLAALVGAPLCDRNPTDAKLVNFSTIKMMADVKSKEQLLIYLNTNSGYGQTDGQSVCTEEQELKPVSLYGKTKCLAEDAVRNVENYIVFRLATIFGVSPRPRTDLLVNNLVYRALKDGVIPLYEGNAKRNYLHIEDLCAGISRAACWVSIPKNNVYNFGNDNINMTKKELCEVINKYIPHEIVQAEYTEDKDKRNYIVSSEKLYKTGFQCYYSLDDGIKDLMKMYTMIDKPQWGNY